MRNLCVRTVALISQSARGNVAVYAIMVVLCTYYYFNGHIYCGKERKSVERERERQR